MADAQDLQFSYIGKTPLLRQLRNASGQFFLFSQYAEDLTEYLGNYAQNLPIPCSFYALELEKPTDWAGLYPDGNVENNVGECDNIKYHGAINIFGKDNVDGINYSEIYCHIDNDAKRAKYELDLSGDIGIEYAEDYVIGYPDNPTAPALNDFGEFIGEILQNEYENGNTFFRINQDAINEDADLENKYDKKYSLTRLLYVLKKNGLITITETNTVEELEGGDEQQQVEQAGDDNNEQTPLTESDNNEQTGGKAGVLSNMALFDKTGEKNEYKYFPYDNAITEIPVNEENTDKKFTFNCIIVCYSYKNMTDGTIDDTIEIPMGIYFTGYSAPDTDDDSSDNFANAFTKYVCNNEIYNQGTSYTLRICMRTIASQATEQGSEIVNIISASNTGEWVNEYEQLMCKFDETNNTLEEALSKYDDMNTNIMNNLELFRNNRTNVPYTQKVGEYSYWFVNGTNTGRRVIEPEDYADWSNPNDRIDVPIRQVQIITESGSDYMIEPEGTFDKYIGGAMEMRISGELSTINITVDNTQITYTIPGITYPYTDEDNDITIDYINEDEEYYTLTLNDIRGSYYIKCNQ